MKPRKVSCVMATLPTLKRFAAFKRSVQCYCDQTYLNKELIIVLDPRRGGAQRIRDFVASLNRHDIRVFEFSGKKVNLAALRNACIQKAQGPLVCYWDDDDLHHPRRLAMQASILNGKSQGAVFLGENLHYFPEEKRIYWTDWRRTAYGCLTGTGLFFKKHCPRHIERGSFADRGEDSVFFVSLARRTPIYVLSGHPYLYVYQFTGQNTFDRDHHREIATQLSVSGERIERRRKSVHRWVQSHGLNPSRIFPRGGEHLLIVLGKIRKKRRNAFRPLAGVLSVRQIEYIQTIREKPGRSIRELALLLGTSKQAVAREVLRLTGMGLLDGSDGNRIYCDWSGITFLF